MSIDISRQIKDNNLKVYVLMGILTFTIGVLGTFLSYLFNWGITGTGYFLLASGIINFIGYFYSDKIVLRIANAKLADRDAIPELYEIVQDLCHKMRLPIPKLYTLDDNSMNAFATGRDYEHSAVAVSIGMLKKMNKREVEAVLAHELSHIRNYDMRTMAIVSVLVGFISIAADMYWSSSIVNKAQEKDSSGYMAILGLVLSVFAPLAAFFIQMAISRKREYVADMSAAHVTDPKSLASALRKISMDIRLPKHFSASTAHLYFSTPSADSFIDRLFSTHPPIEQRISALEKL